MNSLIRTLSSTKQNMDERRAARREHRQLADEIRSLYATPSGRSELDAVMRRHTPEEVAELDAILGSLAAR